MASRTDVFAGLAAHGDRAALITADGELSYRDLAARVAQTADQLGARRRLVLLPGANQVGAVVTYLAALSAGHPVLLVPGDRPEAVQSMIGAYDPDVVVRPDGERWVLDERRATSAHTLHPDLALLLSTSGSTGSPKLVRLSHQNLRANAEAIAGYLGIRASDRAATTLPMHYCYGLSVVNSHLLAGAGLILTGLSVADSCFWQLFRDRRGTTFAAVPYTFDLLDRVGFTEMRLPHLRYLTQAGGRLAPDRVAHYADVGHRAGWQLFVMYGQTEATARMAYLPPELARSRPQAIGVPIPGGSFQLRQLPDWPDPDTGELVYTGPNVMLGYAHRPADLALGRTVHELSTGDIARRAGDGLYEVVGRRSRFAKILGLRIDPGQVEAMLAGHGVTACCVGGDGELVVAVTGGVDAGHVRRLVAGQSGLPGRAVRVCPVAELPRLATGKPDYPAIRALAGRAATPAAGAPADRRAGVAADPVDLCRLYAQVLDRTDVTERHSFVDLGGDSLSYVEMSLRLEQALGHLPADWHTRPIGELRPAAPHGPGRARRWPVARRRLETSVALRAIAILLIVGSHVPNLFLVKGGAHLLLGVAGFNFARFQLTGAGRGERIRRGWASLGRVALPSMAWITGAYLLTDDYGAANVLLLHSVLGPDTGSGWNFWFIEALVYILVAVLVLITVPVVDRAVRRYPFGFPLALVGLGLVTRYDLLGVTARGAVPSAVVVFWLFALGWAAARAGTAGQRLVVTAALATVPGFFGEPLREAVIMSGLALLIWVPSLPSLPPLNRVAGLLAGSSLYIYLSHWQVYPRLDGFPPLLALAASLGVGIGFAAAANRLTRWLPARVIGRLGWPKVGQANLQVGDNHAHPPVAPPAPADHRRPARTGPRGVRRRRAGQRGQDAHRLQWSR